MSWSFWHDVFKASWFDVVAGIVLLLVIFAAAYLGRQS